MTSSHVSRTCLRLITDLKTVAEDPPWGCSASPLCDSSWTLWTATICGPQGGVWEEGIFPLLLEFGDDYPETPPSVTFNCRMFHPNVLPDGEVCKDVILTSWSPCNNISTILTSIQYMLSEPDLGFLVTEMATELYLTDREFYNGIVREMVKPSIE